MSTTALHIIELVKSLSPADQQAVCAALARLSEASAGNGAPRTIATAFQPEDYEGLPDDDPFFKVIEEIEQQRHAYPGRSAPELD